MSWSNMNLSVLVGKSIEAVHIHDGQLYVRTEDGTAFRLEPEGDCCASCYVQHVSGTDALAKGAVVSAVEDIEGKHEEHGSCDVSDTWGHRLTTSKGHCSIEMRVDHNGYYGGTLNVHAWDGDALPGKALDDF